MYAFPPCKAPFFQRKCHKRQFQKSKPGICSRTRGRGKWRRTEGLEGKERILSGCFGVTFSFQSSLVLMYPQELASHLPLTSTSTSPSTQALGNCCRSRARDGEVMRASDWNGGRKQASKKIPAYVYMALLMYQHILFFIYLPQI